MRQHVVVVVYHSARYSVEPAYACPRNTGIDHPDQTLSDATQTSVLHQVGAQPVLWPQHCWHPQRTIQAFGRSIAPERVANERQQDHQRYSYARCEQRLTV